MRASSIRIKKDKDEIIISFESSRKARIAKVDEDRQIVFGYANVCVKTDGEMVVDSQEDMIDPEELENAAYNFVLNFSDEATGEDHVGVAKGKLIESFFITPEKLQAMGLAKNTLPIGWWVGFHVVDKKAWEKVKRGDHRMFSIQGYSLREEAD